MPGMRMKFKAVRNHKGPQAIEIEAVNEQDGDDWSRSKILLKSEGPTTGVVEDKTIGKPRPPDFVRVGAKLAPAFKTAWVAYCKKWGQGFSDPGKYDEVFLGEFAAYAARLIQDDLDGGSLPSNANDKKDEQAVRVEPEFSRPEPMGQKRSASSTVDSPNKAARTGSMSDVSSPSNLLLPQVLVPSGRPLWEFVPSESSPRDTSHPQPPEPSHPQEPSYPEPRYVSSFDVIPSLPPVVAPLSPWAPASYGDNVTGIPAPMSPGAPCAPERRKLTIRKSIAAEVRRLNSLATLSAPIRLGAVAEALSLLDDSTAMGVLAETQDPELCRGDPTQFVATRAQALVANIQMRF